MYESSSEGLKLTAIRNGTAAHQAGFSCGDLLIAVQGLKASENTLKQLLNRANVGDVLQCHLFRQQRLLQLDLTLVPAAATVAVLKPLSQRTAWPGIAWPQPSPAELN